MKERDSAGGDEPTLRPEDVIPLSPGDRRKSPLAVRMMFFPLALLLVGEVLLSATALYFVTTHDADDIRSDLALIRGRLEQSALPPSEKRELDEIAARNLERLRKLEEARGSFPPIMMGISAAATFIPLILATLIVRYLLKKYPELGEDR